MNHQQKMFLSAAKVVVQGLNATQRALLTCICFALVQAKNIHSFPNTREGLQSNCGADPEFLNRPQTEIVAL